MTDTATSLVEVVSRFVPLATNGSEATARCVFCSSGTDTLKVGDSAWRTLCCGQEDVNGADSAGFLMSWSGCSRDEAEHQLSNGGLPPAMPVQVQPLRRACFWGLRALLDSPKGINAIVWVHWVADGVHFGREHLGDGRIHLGLCSGRPIDDESISLLDGRSCILIPDNRESSFERMDELASKLYAAGHTKVRYVRLQDQEDCYTWPSGMTPEQALTFVQEHVSTYPNNGAAQDYSQRPNRSDSSDEPPLAPPNASPSGPHTHAVSASGLEGGAPYQIDAREIAQKPPVNIEIPIVINDATARAVSNSINAAPTPAPAVASGHHPLVPPPIDTAGVGDAPNIAPDRSGSPPGVYPDDPGPVAPPGTPKARKSPPDLAVVDDTGAVRKPRLEITVDPDQLPAFSEFALAKAFADGPGVDWRYTAAWGLWAKWNSIRWVQDEKKLITWEARNCCAAVMQDHLADSTPSQRMKVATFKTTNAVIGLALADPRIATGAAQWDADPWLLGTPAGVVDLRTGKTVPPDKAQFISKSTLVAPAEGAHPLFDMVIARPGTGEGMLPFLWRWLGYILSGDVREERFLFLHGLGNSGKGTLIKVIADILGDYAKVVAIQAFTESQHQRHSQEIAKLQGARFVYASETEEGSRFDEAMLKWLTGRDKITAHKMRQDDIEFYPQFKLLIYGNNRPSLKSVGEDMRRRIDLIEFPGTIPESERDATLKDRLREEYPAILASMIAACVKWQAHGLGKPQTVANATENYLRMNDVLGEFIEDCLDIAQEAFSLSGAAYKRFSTYCADKGEKYVMSHRTFTQRLEVRGYPAAKVGGQRIYRGFALRSGDADPGASERPSWMRDD